MNIWVAISLTTVITTFIQLEIQHGTAREAIANIFRTSTLRPSYTLLIDNTWSPIDDMASTPLSYLDLVATNDNFPYTEFPEPLYSLHLPQSPHPHGYLLPANIAAMPWSPEFKIDHTARTVTLTIPEDSDRTKACNAAFATVINSAIDNNTFKTLNSMHSEPFPILGTPYPVRLERFAADLFGITARGAHLTVYTRTSTGDLRIWVPHRNPEMFTYPNKLDTTVAGGVSADETPFENIVREAQEEASLPASLTTKQVKAAGVLTYVSYTPVTDDGIEAAIVPDVIYVYDLEVGSDVVPVPEDGEVKEFYLMSVEEVREALGKGEFKTNSAVVMIDFFIRHGVVTAEEEGEYVEIVQRMHRRLPFPVRA